MPHPICLLPLHAGNPLHPQNELPVLQPRFTTTFEHTGHYGAVIALEEAAASDVRLAVTCRLTALLLQGKTILIKITVCLAPLL